MELRVSAISLICMFAAGAAIAEEYSMSWVSNAITDALKEVHGSEVPIKGAIGVAYGDEIRFCDETGVYDVKLDAGREARKTIEGCKFECDFRSPSENQCQITGMAEIEVQWDRGGGGRGFPISLIIYDGQITKKP